MNSTPSLKGQSALVTGADSGIGKGVAMAIAAAGANVIINHVDAHEVAEQTVDEMLHILGYSSKEETIEPKLPKINKLSKVKNGQTIVTRL